MVSETFRLSRMSILVMAACLYKKWDSKSPDLGNYSAHTHTQRERGGTSLNNSILPDTSEPLMPAV